MKNAHQIYFKNLFYFFIFIVLIFSIYFVKAECITGQIDSAINEYCDINGVWQSQKADGAACQNNFECLIDSCKGGICQEFDILKEVEKQQSWIDKILNLLTPTPTPPSGGGSDIECGNNDKERGEVCDGTDLVNKNCFLLGFTGGVLRCSSNCTAWNTTGCFVNIPNQATPCVPICSSTCGGESSGCGGSCVYNNGAYCGENKICSSGSCIEQLECRTDSDCLENEICQYNKCLTKPKKSMLPTVLIILSLLLIIGVVAFLIIKKKKSKRGGVISNKKQEKSNEAKSYY